MPPDITNPTDKDGQKVAYEHLQFDPKMIVVKVAMSLTLSPKKAHTLLKKHDNGLCWCFHFSPISDFTSY
jgi:hypothetical protein